MNGAQVGKVASIEHAARRSAPRCTWRWTRTAVPAIPANVGAEITSSTVFGSKFVELVPPD